MLSLAWLEVWRWCRQREMYWTAAGSLPTTPYSDLNTQSVHSSTPGVTVITWVEAGSGVLLTPPSWGVVGSL